jgi:serine phosphatase RsbU (regulator of sigma subunit)
MDPATGEMLHCSAGHPPALLVRADGRVERLSEGGLPLGLFPEAEYGVGRAVLEHGDRLVLHTDGITEAAPGPGRDPVFGSERLVEAMRGATGADAACGAILAALDAFVDGTPLRDDATLVVVARR